MSDLFGNPEDRFSHVEAHIADRNRPNTASRPRQHFSVNGLKITECFNNWKANLSSN